ncbi:MAG TPA: NAD(P)(+) transhydrogenase (Re/Si-specific) subunit beta [Gammaproteobacteria bacterium]|nr:NAD(P)(+) transhydrogenase (Re/Si-specific) subunit beta [Gammaproteobacteria bacterium]
MGTLGAGTAIQASYFIAAALFIFGLKRMSSPVTARSGIVWAGVGMVVATLITFLTPGMSNYALMTVAIAVGGIAAWVTGRRVAMTNMPQMIALYNGMGGGAAGAIAAVELFSGEVHARSVLALAVLGGIIGAVSFSGSLIAFGKLQGLIKKSFRFRGQNIVNLVIVAGTLVAGSVIVVHGGEGVQGHVTLFLVLALLLGITMTLPIGGADMPVVISLYNALTGLAVAFEGFVLNNAAMIIAGTVVGSAGTLLTQLMAKAMNRSLANVLFSGFGETAAATATGPAGTLKAIETADAAVMLGFSEKVIVVPGYGMAVAQAQHKVWELCQALIARGVTVKFAIHPVAGRMPGHMNVLLAEAGVPYDLIYDEGEINSEFETADVALIIGANDVVNPVARTDKSSPIYGMPILNADKAKNVIVIKRGQGAGFSGIENALFYLDHARMLYGDGQAKAAELVQAVKAL